MRIVVAIKQVPETNDVKMDEATGTMIRQGVEAIVNPLDLYAIELALQLRGRHGGSVTAISMGPPQAMTALREAVSMGCDWAVLVSDKALAGSDTWATSAALAGAIRKLAALPAWGPANASNPPGKIDLVICGERATDGDTGQVGPGLAAMLGLPVVTYVSKVDSAGDDSPAVLHRRVEDGYEVIEARLPAVLTVVKEVADPRLPTLRGKRLARTLDIPVWTIADLGIAADRVGLSGSPTRVVKVFRPQVARQGRKIIARDPAGVEQAAREMATYLKTSSNF